MDSIKVEHKPLDNEPATNSSTDTTSPIDILGKPLSADESSSTDQIDIPSPTDTPKKPISNPASASQPQKFNTSNEVQPPVKSDKTILIMVISTVLLIGLGLAAGFFGFKYSQSSTDSNTTTSATLSATTILN